MKINSSWAKDSCILVLLGTLGCPLSRTQARVRIG